MTDLIPIGRFAQITHLSVKALRLYAKAGLLQPVNVDPESGYRYYLLSQAALAARIRLLRLVEMPLEEIRAVSQPVTQFTILTHQRKLLLTLRGQFRRPSLARRRPGTGHRRGRLAHSGPAARLYWMVDDAPHGPERI
jgi:DNA-binding transcriptional MerR regulator